MNWHYVDAITNIGIYEALRSSAALERYYVEFPSLGWKEDTRTEETTWTCHQCGKTYTNKWWREPDWLQLRVEKMRVSPGQYSTVTLRVFCSAKCLYNFTQSDDWTLMEYPK